MYVHIRQKIGKLMLLAVTAECGKLKDSLHTAAVGVPELYYVAFK